MGIGSRVSARAAESAVLRETRCEDSRVPRLELAEWASRYGVTAGITSREGDFSLGLWTDESSARVQSRWGSFRAAFQDRFLSVVFSHQVHGTKVARHAGQGPGWLVLDGLDGHVTTDSGVLLTISVADCIPVYIVEPESGAVALLHSGWRGTADGILARGVAEITGATGVTSDKLVIHCGVGICGECYEVGSEVAARFVSPPPEGPTHVDLRQILAAQARAAGVQDVTVSPWCSAHDRDRFFSHRASGGRDGRMVAYIGRPRT